MYAACYNAVSLFSKEDTEEREPSETEISQVQVGGVCMIKGRRKGSYRGVSILSASLDPLGSRSSAAKQAVAAAQHSQIQGRRERPSTVHLPLPRGITPHHRDHTTMTAADDRYGCDYGDYARMCTEQGATCPFVRQNFAIRQAGARMAVAQTDGVDAAPGCFCDLLHQLSLRRGHFLSRSIREPS
jgi:hypothetical protein